MPSDDERIEDAELVTGTELEIAGISRQGITVAAPSTLFRTDDPAEIVRKATEIADALSGVLKARNLTKRIGQRDFVQVEGWTLCGSMLGVFAVVEWTRKLENGWEARAVAKTLGGQEVGAAEAECLRSESKWKDRDDYAIRSMAQTRAVSKALRAPLGFVVQLAGFEATPAEEMPSEAAVTRQEGRPAYPVPKSWAEIEKGVRAADNALEAWALFEAFVRACSYHLHGKTDTAELTKAEIDVLYQKSAGAVVWLHENVDYDGPFLYFTEDAMRRGWAHVLDGDALEIPDYEPPEPPGVDEDAERIAAEVFAEGADDPA